MNLSSPLTVPYNIILLLYYIINIIIWNSQRTVLAVTVMIPEKMHVKILIH